MVERVVELEQMNQTFVRGRAGARQSVPVSRVLIRADPPWRDPESDGAASLAVGQ